MNLTCPERLDWYSFLDGELSAEQARVLRRHLEICSECRVETENLSRFAGQLESRPSLPPDDALGFEDRFLVRLLSRMEESRSEISPETRRSSWVTPVLLALVPISALLVWLVGRIFEPDSALVKPAPETWEPTPVVAIQTTPVRSEEFLAWLNAEGPIDLRAGQDLQILLERSRRQGFRVREHLAALVFKAKVVPDISRLEFLVRRAEGDPIRMLDVLADGAGESPQQIEYILNLALRFSAGNRWVAGRVNTGLPRVLALRTFLAHGGAGFRKAAEDLMLAAKENEFSLCVREWDRIRDPAADQFLLQVYLGGRQSVVLRQSLAGRNHLIHFVRREAASPGRNQLGRERAVELLGLYGDPTAIDDLARWARPDDPLAPTAMDALARIGSDEARRRLGARIDLRDERKWTADDHTFQAALSRVLPRLGVEGAECFLNEADMPSQTWRPHFVLAAGSCRAPSVLPRLLAKLEEDDVKTFAVRAMARIGDEFSRQILRDLCRHADPDIAREARTVLRLSEPSKPRPRQIHWVRGQFWEPGGRVALFSQMSPDQADEGG